VWDTPIASPIVRSDARSTPRRANSAIALSRICCRRRTPFGYERCPGRPALVSVTPPS